MNLYEIIKYNKYNQYNIFDIGKGFVLNGYNLNTNTYRNLKINEIKTFKSGNYYLIDDILFFGGSKILYKDNDMILSKPVELFYEDFKINNNLKLLNFYLKEIDIKQFEYIEMPKTKWASFVGYRFEKYSIFLPYSEKQILIADTI